MSTSPTPTVSILLSSSEAAQRLNLRPQSLRRWRLVGCGPPYIRLGGPQGRVAYRVSDIEKWLDDRCFTSTSSETVSRDRTTRPEIPSGGAPRRPGGET